MIRIRHKAAGLAAVIVAGLGLAALLDQIFPPNLTRYHDRSTVVLDERGGILRAFTTGDDKWRLAVTPDDVDENYISVLIAYEDQRFERHWGVDPLAVLRASAQWVQSGRIVSGASTLTMQTARLLEPRPRTLMSKLVEMARAVQLEWRYDKDEILSIYLTLAPFGGNLEGVRAASLAYFGKDPHELSVSQAALLVALPQSPERLRPDREPHAAAAARERVLDVLQDRGALSRVRAHEANDDPIPDARAALPFRAPRLARFLRPHAREGIVRSTVDPTAQAHVDHISRIANHGLEEEASAAIVVVENTTGRVVAYSGGSNFWGPGGQMDLARAVRSPGSALKPFIYGMGFDDLPLHPETLITDQASLFGTYAPQNFDRAFLGDVTVRVALQQSLNVPAVMVLDGIGPQRLAARLRQGGLGLSFGARAGSPSLPLALGGVGINLLDLTMAYTALANDGIVRPLIFVETDQVPDGRRIMSAEAAWYVRDILEGSPLPDGRGQGQGHMRSSAVAFKTGTSYGYRDAWAVGVGDDYTVGVWVGRPDGTPRPGAIGRNTAAPILLDIFDGLPATAAPRPRPEGVLAARHRNALPAPLRRYTPAGTGDAPAPHQQAAPLQIAFPPNGAQINAAGAPLALRAVGGTPPLRWIVDGAPLPAAETFEQVLWQTPTAGFYELVVVDAAGRVDRAQVRVAGTTP